MGIVSDFIAQNIVQHQRPVSVQEQPINVQRPLFSAPVGSSNSSGSESASSANLFNNTNSVKPLNDFDALNDAFFNHTLQSITSAFMPITTSSSLSNGFLSPEFNVIDGSFISAKDSAGSLAASANTNAAIGRQGLPLPIGGGTNGSGSKNASNIESMDSSNNKTNTTTSTNLNSVDSLQERPYDPFGKSMPFELKLSSLKL